MVEGVHAGHGLVILPKYEKQPKRIRKNTVSKADSKAAYEAVAVRSAGVCEGCGAMPATEIHHRLYRSRGGKDTIDNLMHLCGSGNIDGCHGDAHTLLGEQRGWSVLRRNDPLFIPAFRLCDGLWREVAVGQIIPAEEATRRMLAHNQIKDGA